MYVRNGSCLAIFIAGLFLFSSSPNALEKGDLVIAMHTYFSRTGLIFIRENYAQEPGDVLKLYKLNVLHKRDQCFSGNVLTWNPRSFINFEVIKDWSGRISGDITVPGVRAGASKKGAESEKYVVSFFDIYMASLDENFFDTDNVLKKNECDHISSFLSGAHDTNRRLISLPIRVWKGKFMITTIDWDESEISADARAMFRGVGANFEAAEQHGETITRTFKTDNEVALAFEPFFISEDSYTYRMNELHKTNHRENLDYMITTGTNPVMIKNYLHHYDLEKNPEELLTEMFIGKHIRSYSLENKRYEYISYMEILRVANEIVLRQ